MYVPFSIKARSLVIAFSPLLAAGVIGMAGLSLFPKHTSEVLVIGAILSSFCGCCVAIFLADGLLHRIRKIINSTALIKAGIPVIAATGESDELGELAASIAEMSVRILHQRAEMSEDKNRLEAIFRATKHTAILAEDVKGRVILCNPGAERLLGYLRDEIMGRSLDEVIYRDAHSDFEPELRRAFQAFRRSAWQNIEQDQESVFIRKNGMRVDVQVSIAPLKDMNGKAIGLLHVAHDISPRKILEAELRHRNTELTNDRLASNSVRGGMNRAVEDILPTFVRGAEQFESSSIRALDGAIRKRDPVTHSSHSNGKKLLVVDDFEATRTLIKVQLSELEAELDFCKRWLRSASQNCCESIRPNLDGYRDAERGRA